MDIEYHPFNDRQVQLGLLMDKQGGPLALIQTVMRNLTFIAKCLADVDTDEMIRAVHESEKLSKTDLDYVKIHKLLEEWLITKKHLTEYFQKLSQEEKSNHA